MDVVVDCIWTTNTEGKPTCTVCGWTHPSFTGDLSTLYRNCDGPVRVLAEAALPPEPTTVERAARFAAALAKHYATGAHMRTAEEIAEILDQHCKPCEFFTGFSCRKCGCNVNNERKLLNKLAMQSQHCPLDPPKW